ncbi:syringomycin E biosynthesis aminoacyltransferase SyrC [Pseudomonas sp. TH31]|uniref:syringomycin E biosynthesis aminoacyltransferase SyrC n=1 Tax=Pseudomonas sp. TH31 TaxID=2796396 RepID=UPI001913CAD9|nr:syringomycin E biosynthesis aminoacyltransferase SyrC [Pseudomonas sp. TH31]MBK5418655.1 alpha/beta hydrolase [Pseudomonas sp. TH31]
MTIATDAAMRLCETVRMLRHLAIHLPDPICLSFLAQGDDCLPEQSSPSVRATERAVNAALARIGVRTVQYLHDGEDQLSSFEIFISRKICEALDYSYDRFDDVETVKEFGRLVRQFDFSGAVPEVETLHLITRDNVALSVHASANRECPAIVLALPCGMPFDLCRDWFNALSERFFVVTWETRGLFGSCTAFDQLSVDTDAQVGDLINVMNHYELPAAHLMGICGGAVIALSAAAAHHSRVSSLSLWHGDYNLGDNSLRTAHQQNFEWLMETAAVDRNEASDLQALFLDQATLASVPESIAHVALYPYVNEELFYRYARLNDALNKTELQSRLEQINVPTLVVAGDADETTHIGGSRHIADAISDATLHVERNGSHLAFFESTQSSKQTAFRFLESNVEPAVI